MDLSEKMNEKLAHIKANKNKILDDFVEAYLASLDPFPQNIKEFIESVDLFYIESFDGGLLFEEAIKDTEIKVPSYSTRVARFVIKPRKGDITFPDVMDKANELKHKDDVTNYYRDALELVLRYINDPILTAQFNV